MRHRNQPGIRRVAALARHDGAGVDLTGSLGTVGTRMRRLHRCRRGNVTILVLLMGLVFYALAAMVWNTGQVTSAKIETQTAADAAAYSSAVVTSRAMNVITGTNMQILRHETALYAALTQAPVLLHPFVFWARIPSLCGPPTPVTAPCWIAYTSYYFAWEFPNWLFWLIHYIQGLIALPDIIINLSDLRTFQDEWVNTFCPQLIQDQVDALEVYYDCDIEVVRGDGTNPILPPLQRGRFSMFLPLFARAFQESWNSGDSWHNQISITGLIIGKGTLLYEIGWVVAFAVNAARMAVAPHGHYTFDDMGPNWPVPELLPIEFGPTAVSLWEPNAWDKFTVVATARKRDQNALSRQPPREPLTFMAPGLFKDPVNPVAYAQAETFNGFDGWNESLALLPIPWRLWTHWGWQWQPRLSHGDPTHLIHDHLKESLVAEPDVAYSHIFRNLDVRVTSSTGSLRRITTH